MNDRLPVEGGVTTPRVVCVGASAGGLEAFTELLSHLPADTGMAFVLVQHLDPWHDSHLTELLAKSSKMPVAEVQQATPVEADHVYVIPPGHNLAISHGVLELLPRPETGRNMPIDSFLRTLAVDCGSRAIGVVLSGTASDGTAGLEAVKDAGGITFAQDRRTAKFEAMPAAAVAAGVVDFVLPPEGIARKLAAIAGAPSPIENGAEGSPDAPPEGELARILRLLRDTTSVDFTHYKRNTILRRVRRRMVLRGFSTLEDYRKELDQNREEVTALCESCFITVTSFFRDPAVFEQLKQTVFPALLENRADGDPIRIWTPGCATGEEAYSIAMCLVEYLAESKQDVHFEVFASDISAIAIEAARAGFYPSAAMSHVSAERTARFFIHAEGGFQIAKSLRDVCVFARHDLARDPPFSHLDLISCCNVLIYLGPDLQRKVLSTLHYALKPEGFLVLGASESVGALSGSFHPVEGSRRVLRVRAGAGPPPTPAVSSRRKSSLDLREKSADRQASVALRQEADRLVLARHGPPGVILDDDMNVVQVRGHTAPYLELPAGNPSRNILKMAREGLIAALGKAMREARQANATAAEQAFRIEETGELRHVVIRVIPLTAAATGKNRHYLALFEDAEPEEQKMTTPEGAATHDGEVARLRRELEATREYLQALVDEKAVTLDELRIANEEAQAANEELETAQEELESANEELNTLNEDLRLSNAELKNVNRDLANLLESISIPLVMVDCDLRIRRFTRAVEPMLSLIASDVGRSITDLQPRVELPDLRGLLLDAMEGRSRKPRDVRDADGHWYSLRILPSVGANGKIDGAVLMWIDIDAAKRGLDFAEAIVETVREPLVILNQNLEVLHANRAFYDAFRATSEQIEGHLIYDLGNGQWNIPQLRELLENVLPAHATFRHFEVTHEFEHVGRKVMLLNAREIFNPNSRARSILLAIEDVTDRKRAEEALRARNAELQQFAYALTHDLQEPLRVVVNFTQLLNREYGGQLGGEADQYMAFAVEGALRIEALLKALLAFWQVTQRDPDNTVPVDCNEVLAKVLLNLRVAIEQSGAVVTAGPLPTVVTEEVLLVQLFQNLIANSIKYRGPEAPVIEIMAEKTPAGWVFTVRDNGIGIDAVDAESVFGMFRRLHGSEIPGAGIGLALCRKVVERHGGRIWLEPGSEHGATFKFTLPDGPGESEERYPRDI